MGSQATAKPVIICDLDGVLLDTQAAILRRLQTHYGVALGKTPADQTSWLFTECFPDVAEWMVPAIFSQEDFWAEIEPYPHAHEFLWYLRSLGEVHIVTARCRVPREVTVESLSRHQLLCDALELREGRDKPPYAREVGACAAIDDSFENAASLSEACPTVLLDYPFNACDKDLPGQAVRARDIWEAARLIKMAVEAHRFRERGA